MHTAGVEAEGLGETLDELGLAEAGQALEQDVAAREHADDGELGQLALAEEDGVERGEEALKRGRGGGEFGLGKGGRGRRGRHGKGVWVDLARSGVRFEAFSLAFCSG